MDTAVGAEVLAAIDRRAIPRGNLERNLLAGDDGRSDVGRCPGAIEEIIERGCEGIDVVPVDREDRDGIGGHGCGHAGVREAAACGVRVVVALDVHRVFRGNGQTARDGARARGQGNEIAIHELDGPAEQGVCIFATVVVLLQEGSRPWADAA